jgi:hypothetical protein
MTNRKEIVGRKKGWRLFVCDPYKLGMILEEEED